MGRSISTVISDTIWNVRIDGGSGTPEGRKDFAGLVRTFVDDKKIAQMQVNCLSSDVMRKAQQEPENYRDLIVRGRLQRQLRDLAAHSARSRPGT